MELKINLLEERFQKVAPRAGEFVGVFYYRLFASYLEAKPLFANTDMAAQKQKLLGALVLAVTNLRKPEFPASVLEELGRNLPML